MPATPSTEMTLLDVTSDVSLRREFIRVIGATTDLFTHFLETREIDFQLGLQIVNQLRRHLQTNFDAAVGQSVQPLYDSYPVRHSVQSSLLAMAMGIDAGLSDEELRSLGLGSLVHDVGMLLVPSRVLGEGPITERDRQELMRHPLHAAAALEQFVEVAPAVQSVAAQIHERLDGSGYPHKLKGSSIHRLARYAGVADAFLGMISPRPHRAANEPYRAIEEILFAAHRGRFDAGAVRTLLRVVSLYPVGSCVWLNDGRIGRVVRSNPDAVDRPVVIAMNLEHDPPELEQIDLMETTQLTVVRVGELKSSPANGD
ncbi:MAG: HD domain-containing phosphohydrolase [Planctomycetaceae bacterium]